MQYFKKKFLLKTMVKFTSIPLKPKYFFIKRDANGEWRRILDEELHNLYRSPSIVTAIKYRRLRWVSHVARIEEGRSAFKILTGTPTGKRSLGRTRRRREDKLEWILKK
jgi:hypothetical protein